MILWDENGSEAEQVDVVTVLNILQAAYPLHPWHVRVASGVIFIRHLQYPGNWGMNVKFKDIAHDAAVFKREVIMKAGEWLERAGLVRGMDDGSVIARVDGVPDGGYAKPEKARAPLPDCIVVVKADGSQERITARPQVARMMNG